MAPLRSLAVGSLWILSMALGALANPVKLSERQLDGTTKCGPAVCAAGLECCNESCGLCAPPGVMCTQQYCGVPCGPNLCPWDQVCCNESCGVCTPPGVACTTQACLPDTKPPAPREAEPEPEANAEPEAAAVAARVPCGPTVCDAGERCCNSSCGYCTKPGQRCTQEICPPAEKRGLEAMA